MNPYLYKTVIDWIPENSRVLDLGTGDGSFLSKLSKEKNIYSEAVEQNPAFVARCIERGLVTFQGDILDGLDQYGKQSFDYILLLGTLQELFSPEQVLQHSFRVSRYIIVAFTNFAHWSARFQLMFRGISPSLGDELPWYESPNIQFFSSLDFKSFCRVEKIERLRSAYFNSYGAVKLFPNLRTEEALSLIEWKEGGAS